MQYITFYTKAYKKELSACLRGRVTVKGRAGTEYFFAAPAGIMDDDTFADRFIGMLEGIVLNQNNIVSRSKRVFEYMKVNIFAHNKNKILYDVKDTLAAGGFINIDGYAVFRMQQYTIEINKILYSVIRREYK